MQHYIPLQSASLWTEADPVAPARRNRGSFVTFAAAAAMMVMPIALAYVAWDPNSPLYADAMHWIELLRYWLGL